ncbi:MAG: hypothetical protein FWH55_14435, partial [Oscillospiraceae bacterium]|nr:hypothetical protein [Oscillospiraceae bacterium]
GKLWTEKSRSKSGIEMKNSHKGNESPYDYLDWWTYRDLMHLLNFASYYSTFQRKVKPQMKICA